LPGLPAAQPAHQDTHDLDDLPPLGHAPYVRRQGPAERPGEGAAAAVRRRHPGLLLHTVPVGAPLGPLHRPAMCEAHQLGGQESHGRRFEREADLDSV
ncbi:hypothetical protein LTR60_006507, partial [Cryomyces antarcticus]